MQRVFAAAVLVAMLPVSALAQNGSAASVSSSMPAAPAAPHRATGPLSLCSNSETDDQASLSCASGTHAAQTGFLEPGGAAGQDARGLSSTQTAWIVAGATSTLALIIGFAATGENGDAPDNTSGTGTQ